MTVEQGGFGAVAAAPVARQILSQWFFGKRARSSPEPRRRCEHHGRNTLNPIQARRRAGGARPRALLLFDPLLLLAALGLVACSLVTLHGATRTTMPGAPLYYVERQALYAGIGLLLALVLTRIDYSRLREYKYGLYGLMIALNIVVFGMPPIHGAHRWIPLPFFQVQPSEFGKILLIVALAAFVVDRSRRLTSAAPPRGSCCWRCSRR